MVSTLGPLPATDIGIYMAQCYAVAARVRHESSNNPGEVGRYVARRSYPGADTVLQVFTQVTFNAVRGPGRDDLLGHEGARPVSEVGKLRGEEGVAHGRRAARTSRMAASTVSRSPAGRFRREKVPAAPGGCAGKRCGRSSRARRPARAQRWPSAQARVRAAEPPPSRGSSSPAPSSPTGARGRRAVRACWGRCAQSWIMFPSSGHHPAGTGRFRRCGPGAPASMHVLRNCR